ncbi:ABC transporter ATP-binding protein [Leeia sp. TBRC 13508]|uniref:ABC transporter ATP-binding protein n=1 Tax=Leeia speluncae TaxID=2884804 RepID=A0ABS8D6A8_9NEIS|nr:ABC transporter ATP-binding protein [Leeia speluncae]MCB6183672.1 ABC transporter ATP-binding protein [Leeia speluncae]
MLPAIEISGINKQFGDLKALDNVSFSVGQGEFFALLGPNGAGKTTLISILAGLTRADSGFIKVMGHDVVTNYRQARRSIGIVPQELVFDPFFTVRETLVFQSGYFGLKNNDAWIDELLDSLGLANKANVNMRNLSGGMKRRVLVAQALVHKPPVIVLDEPTAGVDVELRQSLWDFIQRLNKEGHTIVLTTHYLEEAEELCNKVAMMKLGKILALDDTSRFLKKPEQKTVSLKLNGQLPDALLPKLVSKETDSYLLKLSSLAELEDILAAIRVANLKVKDLSLPETSLEDAFVAMMHGDQV